MTERVLQSAGFLSRLRGRRAVPRGAYDPVSYTHLHGSGVDAEQRACAFGDLVLHVAVRHQAQKHDVAGESEPEQQMAHCLHAERRRGDGRYDDAHVADEVGWKHLMQFEVRDEASGEPAHQREVRHNGRRP